MLLAYAFSVCSLRTKPLRNQCECLMSQWQMYNETIDPFIVLHRSAWCDFWSVQLLNLSINILLERRQSNRSLEILPSHVAQEAVRTWRCLDGPLHFVNGRNSPWQQISDTGHVWCIECGWLAICTKSDKKPVQCWSFIVLHPNTKLEVCFAAGKLQHYLSS